MYVAIFFGLSTLVRLVRPCSMYVRIFFGLGTLVRLVRPCSVYVGIFFGLSTLVRLVKPSSCVVPVRRFPSPSRSIRFGDVSEANGR